MVIMTLRPAARRVLLGNAVPLGLESACHVRQEKLTTTVTLAHRASGVTQVNILLHWQRRAPTVRLALRIWIATLQRLACSVPTGGTHKPCKCHAASVTKTRWIMIQTRLRRV